MPSNDEATSASGAAGFALVTDDPLYRAQQALGLIPHSGGFGLKRRIAIAIAITWLPLVVFAFLYNLLLPGKVEEPLFEHFGIHVRFLISLPLLLVAEATTQGILRQLLPQFLAYGLVDDVLQPRFREILQQAQRLVRSRVALAVMLVIVAIGAVYGWKAGANLHELQWAEGDGAAEGGMHFGLWWFCFVSRPLFMIVLLAWLWRIIIVTLTFMRIGRLELRLSPTHPDRVGGLGFLERLPIGLAPLFFALALPIAGQWGHDAYFHNLDVQTLKVPAIALVVVLMIVALAPLLAFVPLLRRVRRQSMLAYGALLAEHGRLVQKRWIKHEEVTDDALLNAT